MTCGGPFVGRVEELRAIRAAYARAQAGTATVVLVGGAAGIGKSALVREFVAGVPAARVLTGRCPGRGGPAPPYAPFVAALRALVREIGVPTTGELLPPAMLGRLLPELGAVPVDPAATRDTLFEAIIVLVERLAGIGPLVLVIEDADGADHSTRDLLGFLVRNLVAARVLLIVTHDELPDAGPYLGGVPPVWRGRRPVQLELAGLTRSQVTVQAAAVLGREPAPAYLDEVFARSGGNPLFAQALLCHGPGAVHDLLLVPVERLPARSRRVLRIAAVGDVGIGSPLLAAVTGLAETTLHEALRPAVDGAVLVATDEGYAFRHPLIRTTTYDQLLPEERAGIHRRYAEALEGEPLRVAAAELAHHWYAAGDVPRAFCAAWHAAEQARTMLAPAQRLELLGRLLYLWPRVPDPAGRIGVDRATLLRHAADAADDGGDPTLGRSLAEQALATLDPRRQPRLAVQVYTWQARMRRRLGQPGTAGDLRAALELLPADPPTVDRARVLGYLAKRMHLEGDRSQARALAEEAVLAADRIADLPARAHAITTLASLSAEDGDVAAARAGYAQAREIAARVPAPMLRVRVDLDESDAREGLGEHEQAVRAARSALVVARAAGLSRNLGGRLAPAGHLAEPLVSLGRWDEAVAVVEHAVELAPPPRYLAHLYAVHAGVLLARGDVDAAAADVAAGQAALHGGYDTAADRFVHARVEADVRLAQGRSDESGYAVARAFEAYDPAREPRYAWPLLVSGARAVAAARHEPTRTGATMSERLTGYAETVPCRTAVHDAYRATFWAELVAGTAIGEAVPAAWEVALAAWERTTQPYPLALALLRSASGATARGATARGATACNATARGATACGATASSATARGRRAVTAERLRRCMALAESLGAAPLLREATAIARRARIPVPDRDRTPSAPEPAGRPALPGRNGRCSGSSCSAGPPGRSPRNSSSPSKPSAGTPGWRATVHSGRWPGPVQSSSPNTEMDWVTASWLGLVTPGLPRKSVQHGWIRKSVPIATAE